MNIIYLIKENMCLTRVLRRYFSPLSQQIRNTERLLPLALQIRNTSIFLSNPEVKPRHLICFKQWTTEMVQEIITSAINLKKCFPDTRGIRLPTLAGAKIMILQEVNQPILHMAVSKAATLLGAHDVCIVDTVVWEHDYMGKIFSKMADAIFVSTSTHMCIQRFAEHSTVPVLCMHSRTHATIQALATIMTIVEEFGDMDGLTVGYLGPPHPVLNSYLLLCPMLGANIKFKCCCDKSPVSPLLYKASEEMCESRKTKMTSCIDKDEVFQDANVIIAGPATKDKAKLKYFRIKLSDIPKIKKWIFIHTCPRGEEVDDELFDHDFARTYHMFQNMQYIAAALMSNAVIGYNFDDKSCPQHKM